MTRSQRHLKHTKKIIIALAAALVVFGIGYAVRSNHYSSHFLPKTFINETDIGNLTVSQANDKLKKASAEQSFDIKDNGQVWKSIKKTDFGLKSDFDGELKKLMKDQNHWSWGMAYVFASDKSVDGTVVDESQLDSHLQELKAELDEFNKTRTQTVDAQISPGPAGYTVTPEVHGDNVDVEKVIADVKSSVTNDKHSVDLINYTIEPKITASDQNLKTQVDVMNKVAQVQANYTINGETFQIPTPTIMDWLEFKDGKASLNRDKVKAYVDELGKKYNTSSVATNFHSTRRGDVQVPAGTYSWTIQPDDETNALMEQIMAGEAFTRTPITKGSANAANPLIGNTYIEVDLQNQHMWYYKDGAVALETDIVSGKPKTPTPPGVFYVWEKKQNEVLRGRNDDGSKYASPVKFWMPIDWEGVGIHDSDWQPAYGGALWQTVGSHGCVNTPPDVMAQLYNMVETGTPVLVF